MPTIKIIDTVKIDIYSREHPPPHFHAIYAEFEELIEIESLKTYVGKIPCVQRKKVTDWAKGNKEYLLEVFKQLNPRL
ncbi:DUF4160 domain-containing protein [Mariniphaga sp.]|uniref:DUF4160 domain-containing protein n=1 Tax=Mariniphaga sp. TaxID=1954475 RepID=UPI00356200F4